MKVAIEIPGELPTLNEIIDASKAHYQAYRRMKEEAEERIVWPAKALPKMQRIRLHITWHRKNRRHDPDNIIAGTKFILDSLVTARVIENDGWKEIAGISHSWKVDKHNPRVVVEIEEVEEGAA